MEEWRPVPGHEGFYEVSNMGSIRSIDRISKSKNRSPMRLSGKRLSPSLTRWGHLEVGLCRNNKHKTMRVHRIMAMAFMDGFDLSLDVDHINGIKTDNRIDNFRLLDRSEHTKEGWRRGQHRAGTTIGSKNKFSKINEAIAANIKKKLSEYGEKRGRIAAISREMGLSKDIVGDIARGKTWRHVDAS